MTLLERTRQKNPRLVAGLMSGTSCDGVDVALVEIRRKEGKVLIRLRGFSQVPFCDDFRRALLALAEVETSRIDRLCALNVELARVYADALRMACTASQVGPGDIDLIGSHGQTVHHLPEAGATLQIGEPSVLAEAFRRPVVADFRPKDLAAGGQGAPLVPYVDYLVLHHGHLGRAVQNLGGIGNVTYLPPGASPEQVVAFDTGPGNMVMDGLAHLLSDGRTSFDRGGAMSARGRADHTLVQEMLGHPYFALTPPKSTGREVFGMAYVHGLVERGRARGLGPDDLMATAAALTVESMALGYERFLKWHGPIHEIILSGGGALNPTLFGLIRDRFPSARVALSDEFGLPVSAKEAIAFAVLADETLEGRPNNLPSATGARRPVVLGKIVLPD
ncbi:MAG: anhydro-N-acetylmuramic acid kinase [Planctomycetes bacterium]|nr:anhydro-N-acetylmuramic acid kinase [Planctomycetota bacterium]